MKWKDVFLHPRWKPLLKLNKNCVKTPKDVKYVFLIHKTAQFNVLKDLQTFFKKWTWNIHNFQSFFVEKQCCALYMTFFSAKERKRHGPICDHTSKLIVNILLQKWIKQNPEVTFVSHFKIDPIHAINLNTFQSLVPF